MRQSPLLLGGHPVLAGGFILPRAPRPPNPRAAHTILHR